MIAGASLSLLSWGAGSARGDDISDGGVIASVAGLGFGFMVGAIGSVVITAGATHDEEPERRDVVVAPAVGPDGASLTGRVTF